MLGKKRSFSGAKARLFNDADRPQASVIREENLFSESYSDGLLSRYSQHSCWHSAQIGSQHAC
jgi:hypothetical protein